MTNLINTTGVPTIDVLANYSKGKFRHVVKCRAGFLTIVDARDFENERFIKYPEIIISGFKKGGLQTVQFQPEGSDHWLTLFARVGKKIHLIDETILKNLTVGTINSMFSNTALYSQHQYSAVNSKTWESKAYVMNEAA
jgi:hypothetical protein